MARASTLAADDQLDLADVRRRVRAIFIGSVGNLVEWYDFYTYAAFALYFASSFFPGSDPVVQQLNAALLFALGFVVRPSAAGCSAISPISTGGATHSCSRCCSCASDR